ncbi:protease modulator HflC [Candidatus Woesearchaeota archaeon]|nr:protease modulator HflC [Candidatus Woesearchaeota archaeon]
MSYTEGAGLYFKMPFIQDVQKFDRRFLRWNGYPEEVPTRDKKFIWTDFTALWNIADPLKFLRTVNNVDQAQSRLDDIIDNQTRNSITSRNLIEVVRTDNREMQIAEAELRETSKVDSVYEGRDKIMQEIAENSRRDCIEYGIGIAHMGILLKGLTYVESVKEAVENRMIAERSRIAERYLSEGQGEYERIMGEKERDLRQITSEAYREARGIEGEGDAEALKVYADGFSKDPEFYRFVRTLTLYEESLPDSTKMVIGTDNPLFELLKGKVGKK